MKRTKKINKIKSKKNNIKTITLKSTDTVEKRKEINNMFIKGKIKMLYVNNINNVINYVYEILK